MEMDQESWWSSTNFHKCPHPNEEILSWYVSDIDDQATYIKNGSIETIPYKWTSSISKGDTSDYFNMLSSLEKKPWKKIQTRTNYVQVETQISHVESFPSLSGWNKEGKTMTGTLRNPCQIKQASTANSKPFKLLVTQRLYSPRVFPCNCIPSILFGYLWFRI